MRHGRPTHTVDRVDIGVYTVACTCVLPGQAAGCRTSSRKEGPSHTWAIVLELCSSEDCGKHRVRNLESSTEAGRVETVNNNGHGIVRVSPRYWAFQEPSLTTWHVGTSLSLVREGTTGQSFVLSHFLSNVTDAYKPFRSLDKHVHHQYS